MTKIILKNAVRLCLSLFILTANNSPHCFIFFGKPDTKAQITKEAVEDLKLFLSKRVTHKSLWGKYAKL